jgi:peptide/nickel transport system ATP-binding protein
VLINLVGGAGASSRPCTRSGWHAATSDVSFTIAPGEVVALVGGSGSGKTVTGLALLGLLPASATVTGTATLDGRDLLALSSRELRAVRGNDVGMVFQEPMSTLNPVFTVGAQIVEAIRAHRRVGRAAARRRAVELLGLVGLPDPSRRFRSYPHELSGGQLQRVVIAMAIANDPVLLIADEPTTALDVTVQAGILDLLRDLRARLGMAVLLITHDMGVVADIADQVAVMHNGEVVERGEVVPLFADPRHEYTRELLAAVPTAAADRREPVRTVAEEVAVVRDLSVSYRGRFRTGGVLAVDGVTFHIGRGEVVGLVGESGSGKSTVVGAITGRMPVTGGSVTVFGTDPHTASRAELRDLRRRIGLVFQDPASSLNPRMPVAACIAEPIRLHRSLTGSDVDNRIDDLLRSVELDPALRQRYPHELCGGQRQRVAIARALALGPGLLIADEPTSALDVSVQATVLDLLRRLQADLGFACLFISHDLGVIHKIAHRVAVMYRGRIVEQGPANDVLGAPEHPYTRALIAAAPVADPVRQRTRRSTVSPA